VNARSRTSTTLVTAGPCKERVSADTEVAADVDPKDVDAWLEQRVAQ
jgi:hypothetical protein